MVETLTQKGIEDTEAWINLWGIPEDDAWWVENNIENKDFENDMNIEMAPKLRTAKEVQSQIEAEIAAAPENDEPSE